MTDSLTHSLTHSLTTSLHEMLAHLKTCERAGGAVSAVVCPSIRRWRRGHLWGSDHRSAHPDMINSHSHAASFSHSKKEMLGESLHLRLCISGLMEDSPLPWFRWRHSGSWEGKIDLSNVEQLAHTRHFALHNIDCAAIGWKALYCLLCFFWNF